MNIAQNIFDWYKKERSYYTEDDIAFDLLRRNKKNTPKKYLTLKYSDGSKLRIVRDTFYTKHFHVWVFAPNEV